MKTIFKNLLPIAAVLVFSSAVQAQEAAVVADTAPASDAMPAQLKVIRYSAGDSIPLGIAVPVEEVLVHAKAIHDPADDSIPPGSAVPAQQAQEPVPTRVGRYSAGESIVLGTGQQVQLGSAQAQAKTAGFSSASHLPLAGALADSVTTYIGLNKPGIAEKNSLVNTSAAGLVGLFVVKAGLVYFFEQQSPAIRKSGLKTTAGVWNGVALNNLLLIAGATNPISLVGGALFGAYMYHREGLKLDKEKPLQTAQGTAVQVR